MGSSGSDSRTSRDLLPLSAGAPWASGRGRWWPPSTEPRFGSHNIFCLFHSSLSSFSPFKAL